MKKNMFNKYITVMDRSDNVFITRKDITKYAGVIPYTETRYIINNSFMALDINDGTFQAYFSGKKEYYYLLENNTTIRREKRRNIIKTLEMPLDIETVFEKAQTKADVCYKSKFSMDCKTGKFNAAKKTDLYVTCKNVIKINSDYSKAITDCFPDLTYTAMYNAGTCSPVLFIDSLNNTRAIVLPVRYTDISSELKKVIIETETVYQGETDND